MNFLDSLSDSHRDALMSIATRVPVAANAYLVRRGDPGGDLFVVASGRMAVVDTRTRPTTIIASMSEGDVIGEVAFLDRTPRSADVRAEVDGEVLHWRRADVSELFERNPVLGAAFYEALCRVSVRRLRRQTNQAVTHSTTVPGSANPQRGSRLMQDVESVVVPLKRVLRTVELRVRAAPRDESAGEGLFDALDATEATLERIGASYPGTRDREQITRLMHVELQPWLVRSFLAERCLRRATGTVGSPDTLSHILVGRPSGDGRLGELLDTWFLDRPTMHAFRNEKRALADAIIGDITQRRGRRVLVVNAGTGSLLARLVQGLDDIATTFTVLDPSKESLGYFDLSDLPKTISIAAIRHEITALANGRLHSHLPLQDVIVLDDLICYLPDRLAMTLFRTVAAVLAPEGRLYATSLTDSRDHHLLDLLLGWPTVRREPDATVRLARAVGLHGEAVRVSDAPTALIRLAGSAATDTAEAIVARAPSLF